jgi:hypothetical protein
MAQPSAKALQSSLSKLHIAQNGKGPARSKKAEPVDSWEDEADEDSSDTETESETVRPDSSLDSPAPPPPTPSSPSWTTPHTSSSSPYQTFPPYGLDAKASSNPNSGRSTPGSRGSDDKRPEKSTAVASRLIAAGIGQKAPKRTKEQREYDQAMKVQEKKKRDHAREEEDRKKREKEQALKDVWND